MPRLWSLASAELIAALVCAAKAPQIGDDLTVMIVLSSGVGDGLGAVAVTAASTMASMTYSTTPAERMW